MCQIVPCQALLANGAQCYSESCWEVGLSFITKSFSQMQLLTACHTVTTATELYVLDSLENDIVLGMDWLQKWNPQVDWALSELCLSIDEC